MGLGEATLDPSGRHRTDCALFDGGLEIHALGPESGNQIDLLVFAKAVVRAFQCPQRCWFSSEEYSFLLRSFEGDPVYPESDAILGVASR